LSRRRFVRALSCAGAATLVPASLARVAGSRLKTTSLRLVQDPSSCLAPQYVAEELLRDEGFTDIRYFEVASDADDQKMIAGGAAGLRSILP
jgi:NitT/TauT family transport system substrate-binding protein